MIILDSALSIDKQNISASIIRTLKTEYTFKNPKYITAINLGYKAYGIEPYITSYIETDDFLILPRGKFRYVLYFLRQRGINYELINNRRKVPYKSFKFHGKLRNYQEITIEKALKQSFGTIVAPPGAGKTTLALYMVTKRKQKTLIIVHTKELLNQWIDRINQFLDIPKEKIGIIGDSKFNIKPITVGLVQTLIRKDLLELKKSFGFIIVDECHHISSRTFTKVANQFDSYYMLGLSATPYRRDRLNKLIFFNIGNVVAEIEKEELEEEGVYIKPELITRDTDFIFNPPNNDDNYGYTDIISTLIENEARNDLIIRDIQYESDKENICLILTDRKKHIELLKEKINREYVILTAQTPNKERKEILRNLECNIVFATGQLAGEGLDIPKLNRLFLVTPISWKGRVKQYIGRILRVAKGKKDAWIYDYVDQNVGVLYSQFMRRYKNVYRELIK